MKSVRESYVKHFGEKEAQKLEAAANQHTNGIHDKKGTDPFKWAILICIGYQCIENLGYAKSHNITVPFEKFKKWVKEHAQLSTHDGDCDYLALACGVYNEYVPQKKKLLRTNKS